MSDENCPGTNNKGEPCGLDAGWGTDNDSGPCKFHGGAGGDVGDPGGAPEGNGNAITHGSTADPTNLYENLSEASREWVDMKVATYCGPRGIEQGDPGYDLVLLGVMHMFQARRAHGELAQKGLSRESVVGVTDHGPVTDEEAHYLNNVASGHTRDYRMAMKDAGVLDDPDSEQAAAKADVADALREVLQ